MNDGSKVIGELGKDYMKMLSINQTNVDKGVDVHLNKNCEP